jgi:uncharacterized protein (DUF885 family)
MSFYRILLLFLFPIVFTEKLSAQPKTDSAKLASIAETYWNGFLEFNPLSATGRGIMTHNDQMEIVIGEPYLKTTAAFAKRYLDSLKTINLKKLNDKDRLVAEILRYTLERRLAALKVKIYDATNIDRPVDQFVFSFPTNFATVASGTNQVPFHTVKQYDDFLNRMKIFSEWADIAIANMDRGIRQGNTSPKAAMLKVPDQMKAIYETAVTASVFYKPITALPDSFSATDKARLTAAYANAITTIIQPAYKKLYDYFVKVYIPAARSTSGLLDNAGGKKEYAYLVNFWTTADMSPDAIFDLGIREVGRIRKEMDSIRVITGFKGDLSSFFEYVRTDRQFFPFKTQEEVLDRFRGYLALMEPALKNQFNIVPKSKFEVRATEKFREAGANAQYMRPAFDGSRPGIFYEVIPDATKYNVSGMETLFLHEAIPGHHFQIGLQQEMNMPEFMRSSFFGVFSEGWGLYAETLGIELGMFKDPYQYLGRLNADMERSVRLVVDVGLHHKGWSREKAIEYILTNQPLTRTVAEQRIERYMVLPAQALSYKIGEQKILSLRKLAQEKLGAAFDIREFHDQVLKDGAMPLSLLEEKILRWITRFARNDDDRGQITDDLTSLRSQ